MTTGAAVVVLWLIDVQIYSEPWSIDPWLYTSLMANFDFAYQFFGGTYYAARLPLIIPGVFLNHYLSPEDAYVVLHLAFFLAGGLFMYLSIRSLFGAKTAVFLYPVVLTNAIYVDSHTWDYFDGAVITFLAAGIYFAAASFRATSPVRPTLAGFFLAAAVATNLFAGLHVMTVLLSYVLARAVVERQRALRGIVLNLMWFVAGAVGLLAGCGWFAASNGGDFLFLENAIRALDNLSTAQYKLPTYDWMKDEPRLMVPVFVSLGAVLAWFRKPGAARSPLAAFLLIGGGATYLLLAVWEFAFSGTFLQLFYYFDTLYPFVFIGLAATVFYLLAERRASLWFLTGVGTGAGAAPLIVIYGFDLTRLVGSAGVKVTLVAMVGTLLALSAVLFTARGARALPTVGVLVAVLAAFTVNYGSAANNMTHQQFETATSVLADADDTFAIGAQLMSFTERHELETSLPGMWYEATADSALIGLQSLYFFAYSYLNLKMPEIDEDFRQRTEIIAPKNVVLLCTEPTCRQGPHAMRRAGYRIRRIAAERLDAGSKSIWVQAYALESPTPSPP